MPCCCRMAFDSRREQLRRDWTDQILARIRGFYARYTTTGGGTKVNLQGIVFGTNDGGLLPVEKYLARHDQASRSHRLGNHESRRRRQARRPEREDLGIVWSTLHGAEPLPILESLRARWRTN